MIIGQDEAPRARLGGAQAEALDGALGQPLQLLEGGRHLGAQLLELDAQPRHLVRVRARVRALTLTLALTLALTLTLTAASRGER